jgi:hypothetical protein
VKRGRGAEPIRPPAAVPAGKVVRVLDHPGEPPHRHPAPGRQRPPLTRTLSPAGTQPHSKRARGGLEGWRERRRVGRGLPVRHRPFPGWRPQRGPKVRAARREAPPRRRRALEGKSPPGIGPRRRWCVLGGRARSCQRSRPVMMPTAAGLALPVARASPSGRCPLMSRLARSSVIYGSAPKSGAPWADGASPSIRRVHGERSNRRTGEPPGALGPEAWRLRLAAARCFRAKLGRRPTLRRPSPLDAVAKVPARRLSEPDAEAPAPEASWSERAPESVPIYCAGRHGRGRRSKGRAAPRSGAAPEGPCRAKRTSAAVPRVARPSKRRVLEEAAAPR